MKMFLSLLLLLTIISPIQSQWFDVSALDVTRIPDYDASEGGGSTNTNTNTNTRMFTFVLNVSFLLVYSLQRQRL
jgi:hypothetical protein